VSIASTKQDLLDSFRDREYRAAFNLENVYTTICFQLRALREQREMSQAELGKRVTPKMAQERISILEDPNADSKPTLSTLLRLAEGLDVGLDFRFVPFSKVLERATHTSMRELEVASFDEELPRLEQVIAFEVAQQNTANAPKKPARSQKQAKEPSVRVSDLAGATQSRRDSQAERIAQESSMHLVNEKVYSLAAVGA
jgi:transcriptional regulator with XRE-family HTH domain